MSNLVCNFSFLKHVDSYDFCSLAKTYFGTDINVDFLEDVFSKYKEMNAVRRAKNYKEAAEKLSCIYKLLPSGISLLVESELIYCLNTNGDEELGEYNYHETVVLLIMPLQGRTIGCVIGKYDETEDEDF